jgi:hypothetical protein
MGVNRRRRGDTRLAPSLRSICGMARDSGPTFCCTAPTSLSRRRDHGAPEFGDGKCRLHSSVGSALRHDRSCVLASLSTACSISTAQPNARAVLSANSSIAWKAVRSLNFDTAVHLVLLSEAAFGDCRREIPIRPGIRAAALYSDACVISPAPPMRHWRGCARRPIMSSGRYGRFTILGRVHRPAGRRGPPSTARRLPDGLPEGGGAGKRRKRLRFSKARWTVRGGRSAALLQTR